MFETHYITWILCQQDYFLAKLYNDNEAEILNFS